MYIKYISPDKTLGEIYFYICTQRQSCKIWQDQTALINLKVKSNDFQDDEKIKQIIFSQTRKTTINTE